jgi:hypothetical protein
VDVVWLFLYLSIYWWGAALDPFVIGPGVILIMSLPPIKFGSHYNVFDQMITGLLLGDGSLVKKYLNGGTYFKFAQGLLHLPYLIHVFNQFKLHGLVLMSEVSIGKSVIKGVVYHWAQFSTKSLSEWNALYALWYPLGIKAIPICIGELLTPIAIAYWFMDDGGWTGAGIHLHTNAFSTNDIERLIKVLEMKYNLKCSMHSKNRIYIWARSAPHFVKLIEPHVHPSIMTKLYGPKGLIKVDVVWLFLYLSIYWWGAA